jgi:hypothetical protein
MKALEECGRIAKTLMDATGHAYLIVRDKDFRERSLGVGAGWDIDDEYNQPEQYSRCESPSISSIADTECSTPRDEVRPRNSSDFTETSVSVSDNTETNSPRRSKRLSSQGVKARRAVHQEAEDLLKQAIKIFSETGSLKKSVKFLINKNFMADSPQEIASFLR